MLSDVLGIVEAEGWFDMTRPFEQTIYLSQGAAQCVLLSRNGKPECFVKFTNLVSLAVEAERFRLAFARFTQNVPEFIGYASWPPLEVLVTRAVNFRPLTIRMMGARGDRALINAGLEQLYRSMRDAEPRPNSSRQHAWFDDMQDYFAAAPVGSAASAGLRQLGDALTELDPLPQHGDLVANNLGLRPDKILVVFDWEDYGAVELPGLDLFTLENSIQGNIGTHAQTAEPMLDLARLCDALGISLQRYESLRLAYALAFRFLKRNYNQEIRSRVDAVIERLGGMQRFRAPFP